MKADEVRGILNETDEERQREHLEVTLRRSGPEVLEALNRSVDYFEDLLLGRGPLADLCYVPIYHQSFYSFIKDSPDPEIGERTARLAKLGARRIAKIFLTDAQTRQLESDSIWLQHRTIERQRELGNPAIPRAPGPDLARRMTESRLLEMARDAVDGIIDPVGITVVRQPGSLKKLRTFRVVYPAGPVLKVIIVLEFDKLQLWSDLIGLCHPGKLAAPMINFIHISPRSEFAWPAGMPTEKRISGFLRAIALFAKQIE